jgi:hypothetical protein
MPFTSYNLEMVWRIARCNVNIIHIIFYCETKSHIYTNRNL